MARGSQQAFTLDASERQIHVTKAKQVGTTETLGGEDVLRRLFPAPTKVNATGTPSLTGGTDQQYLVLPYLARARMIVPARPRLAAAAMRHSRRSDSRRGRVLTAMLCLVLRLGASRVIPSRVSVRSSEGGEGIDDHLSSAFGQPVSVGVFLGPPRANRKPVLQALDSHGRLLGIAKVGINPLTKGLARVEATALRTLGHCHFNEVVVPTLIAEDEWHGLSIMCQSALPISGLRTDFDRDRSNDAMREVAECLGVEEASWRSSVYLRGLRERFHDDADGPIVALADLAMDGIESAGADHVVRFGAWHGDWSKWNMAQSPTRTLLWDWERFDTGVPVGYDALHFAFMPLLKATDRASAGVNLLDASARVLSPFGIDPVAARLVCAAYLIEIGARYLHDRQAATGVRGGAVSEWLMPALTRFAPLAVPTIPTADHG